MEPGQLQIAPDLFDLVRIAVHDRLQDALRAPRE
jgi:hypothetical protein